MKVPIKTKIKAKISLPLASCFFIVTLIYIALICILLRCTPFSTESVGSDKVVGYIVLIKLKNLITR